MLTQMKMGATRNWRPAFYAGFSTWEEIELEYCDWLLKSNLKIATVH